MPPTNSSGAFDDPSGLVALDVEVLLDDQLAAVQIVAMHLLDGLLGQVLRPELEDAAAAGLVVVVIEQLNVGHVANLGPEKILRKRRVSNNNFSFSS